MATEDSAPDLVPTFVPPLVAMLRHAEHQNGAPLGENDVLRIRDDAVAIMLPRAAAEAMAASRGYEDIDPERAWAEWQVARAELVAGDET